MPVYQFICEKHGGFEKITIKAEWENIRCPKCGDKARLARQSTIGCKSVSLKLSERGFKTSDQVQESRLPA
jgi:putative FmdB family regulatory protein